MTRPLSLMFAFTLLALPIACGDDDGGDDDETGGSPATGGTTAKGGSGGTTGGSAGKATGGSTGGSKAAAGAGAGGEAGNGIIDPTGGTAGAGGVGGVSAETGGSGGAAGDPGATPEGGTAGAVEPADGGGAGAGGAAELTEDELVAAICSKEPDGDACSETEQCTSFADDFVGDVCTDDLEGVGMALLACWAATDDDEFSCSDNVLQFPPAEDGEPCLAEFCEMATQCTGATEDDLPVCFP